MRTPRQLLLAGRGPQACSPAFAGFTAVELLVAIAAGTVFIMVMYSLLGGGVRAFTGTREKLEAVAIAQGVLEYVEYDLRRLMLANAEDESFFSDPAPRDTLTFVAAEPGLGGATGVLFQGKTVEYSLVPSGEPDVFLVKRNDRVLSNFTVSKLEFRPIRQGTPEDPRFYLQTVVTAVDTFGTRAFTLVSLLSLPDMARWAVEPYWQLNPRPESYRTMP